MIVVAIIAILAAIAIPQLIESRKMSRQNKCLNFLRVAEYAQDQWALSQGYASGYAFTEADTPGICSFIKNIEDCPSGGTVTNAYYGAPDICSYHGSIASPTPLSALTAD